MSLYDRLARAREQTAQPDAQDVLEQPALAPEDAAFDPVPELRGRVHQALLESLGPKLYDQSLTPEQLGTRVRRKVSQILEKEGVSLSTPERKRLASEVTDDILGFGPIEPLLRDPTVTEIMVNSTDGIFVERSGKLERTGISFANEAHLRRIIDKIVGGLGRRIDESQPFVDARLPDGSRVNAVIPPVAVDGALLTVRKFAVEPFRAEDLVANGTLTEKASAFLAACVEGRANIVVSGGTGAGKTTTLNVLSSFIPHDERVITIEDAAELQMLQPHVARLEARPPNTEGRGEITIRDLVRNALRMRPDRIVMGEARGGEALDMLQAMNTGHDGSMSTVHANGPQDAIARLETMCLMTGMELPISAVRHQIGRALQLVVHQARLRDGSRRITHVSEVMGMEGDTVALQDIFRFDFGMGVDANGRYRGRCKSTGIRPLLLDGLDDQGITVPPALFSAERFARGAVA